MYYLLTQISAYPGAPVLIRTRAHDINDLFAALQIIDANDHECGGDGLFNDPTTRHEIATLDERAALKTRRDYRMKVFDRGDAFTI